MKMDLNLTGLDGLTKLLDAETAKTRVRAIVKSHAADLQRKAVRKVPVDTGNLKRSIQPPSIASDGMYAVVRATAEYAPYVELGTRFMEAQPFMNPALNEVRQSFLDALGKVIK